MINSEDVIQHKKSKFIAKRIFVLDNTDSTNLEASRRIESGTAAHGDVIIAASQTSGRGQHGHEWTSPAGNLYMSIITTTKATQNSHLITFATAIACAETIRNLFGLNVSLKWVNDILLNGQKLGGILTESSTRGAISTHITGIGINANSKIAVHDAKLPPVSLKESTGTDIDLNILIAELCSQFEKNFDLFQTQPVEVLKKWVAFSDVIGRMIKFDHAGSSKTGVVQGIDYDGYLVVLAKGEKHTITSSKDIEIDYSVLVSRK